MTNLNWRVDGDAISKSYMINHVDVINDFVAVGYGITNLESCETIMVNSVVPEYDKLCPWRMSHLRFV